MWCFFTGLDSAKRELLPSGGSGGDGVLVAGKSGGGRDVTPDVCEGHPEVDLSILVCNVCVFWDHRVAGLAWFISGFAVLGSYNVHLF